MLCLNIGSYELLVRIILRNVSYTGT